jgi:type VI secretion system protein ImpF
MLLRLGRGVCLRTRIRSLFEHSQSPFFGCLSVQSGAMRPIFISAMNASGNIRRSVFDRLLNESSPGVDGVLPTQTVQQLRDVVARDLEWLLNSRVGMAATDLVVGPNVAKSVFFFGVQDFSGSLLSSHKDRECISENISRAIRVYEPRLQQVAVDFSGDIGAIGALSFTIRALLIVREERDVVSFDAVLHPAASKYQVTHSRLARL